MNRSTNQDDPPGEGLEPLLRAFFRSEMPSPWPAMSRTTPSRPVASGWRGTSSRLALAASVALLLFAGWFLAGKLGVGGPSVMGEDDIAKRPKIEKVIIPPMDP